MPKRNQANSNRQIDRPQERRVSPRAAAAAAGTTLDGALYKINQIIIHATDRAGGGPVILEGSESARLNKSLETLQRAPNTEKYLCAVALCREIGFSFKDPINEIKERLNSLIAKRYIDQYTGKNNPFDVIPAYVKCYRELFLQLQDLYAKCINNTEFRRHLTAFCKKFISDRIARKLCYGNGDSLLLALNMLAEKRKYFAREYTEYGFDWELKRDPNDTYIIIGPSEELERITFETLSSLDHILPKADEKWKEYCKRQPQGQVGSDVHGHASSPAGTFSSAGGGEQGSGSSSMPSVFRVVTR